MDSTFFIYVLLAVGIVWWSQKKRKNQQKQADDLHSSISKGDFIMLNDGLFGTVVDTIGDDLVVNFSVDGADEGCLTVSRASVSQVVEKAGQEQEAAPVEAAAEQEAAPELPEEGTQEPEAQEPQKPEAEAAESDAEAETAEAETEPEAAAEPETAPEVQEAAADSAAPAENPYDFREVREEKKEDEA